MGMERFFSVIYFLGVNLCWVKLLLDNFLGRMNIYWVKFSLGQFWDGKIIPWDNAWLVPLNIFATAD